MGQYTNKGLYNGYKKNNKEREELDYYATPTCEVENILNAINLDFNGKTILEPCVGGGHMMNGIINYCEANGMSPEIIGTDVKDRGYKNLKCKLEYELDFLSDDYPYDKANIIIMNPPYSTIEPFLIRSLEIAEDYLIVLCRTQGLEGSSRYEKIFEQNPPTFIYQYVDRIQCWKNGTKPSGTSAQAYAWLIWDKNNSNKEPIFRWIRRNERY